MVGWTLAISQQTAGYFPFVSTAAVEGRQLTVSTTATVSTTTKTV